MEQTAKKRRIVIGEDDVLIGEVLRRIIVRHGYEVLDVVRDARTVEKRVIETEPDLIVLDVHLNAVRDGIETARNILATRQLPIIFLSGDSGDIVSGHIAQLPGTVLLGKPVVAEELIETIRELLGDSSI